MIYYLHASIKESETIRIVLYFNYSMLIN